MRAFFKNTFRNSTFVANSLVAALLESARTWCTLTVLRCSLRAFCAQKRVFKRVLQRTPNVTADQVLEALHSVTDPKTGRDVVAAGMISGVRIQKGQVRFILTLAAEGQQGHAALEEVCRDAVAKLPGVASVLPVVTAEVAASAPPSPERAKARWNTEPLPHVRRIIAIASGKGGVGKSTTTVYLARALAAQGVRVGVLDADIHGPSIPRMMGEGRIENRESRVEGRPEEKSWLHQAHGIKYLSTGILLGDKAAVMRGPMVVKTLVQMLRGVAWGTEAEPLDLLLIDLPPGTGDVHLSMVQNVPLKHGGGGAIIVTTPQEVALDDARKAAQMFTLVGVPVLGVVENMSYFTDPAGQVHHLFGFGGGQKLADELGVPLLASIPLLPELGRAADEGAAISCEAYQQLAEQVASA